MATSRARELATLHASMADARMLPEDIAEQAIQQFAREMAKLCDSRARNFDGLNAGDAFARKLYADMKSLVLDAAGITEGRDASNH